jgi:hypothetical protein
MSAIMAMTGNAITISTATLIRNSIIEVRPSRFYERAEIAVKSASLAKDGDLQENLLNSPGAKKHRAARSMLIRRRVS